MKYLIEINDNTPAGKTFLELAKMLLAKDSSGIDILDENAIEEVEDSTLLEKMETAKNTGLADSNTVLRKLGLQ